MASTLAAQLQLIAAAKPVEKHQKGKASFLYESQEAADVGLVSIYASAVVGACMRTATAAMDGFATSLLSAGESEHFSHTFLCAAPPAAGFGELCRRDARFESFNKPLFSKAASELNRELQVGRCSRWGPAAAGPTC